MWKSKQIKTVIQMSMYRDHLFGWQTFFISLWRNATSASVHFVDTVQCYLWVSEFPVHSFNFLKKLQSKTFRSSEIGNLGNYSKIQFVEILIGSLCKAATFELTSGFQISYFIFDDGNGVAGIRIRYNFGDKRTNGLPC